VITRRSERWFLMWVGAVPQYNSPDYKKYIRPMFYLEPCIYGHRILSNAASVFAAVRNMPAPPTYLCDPPADALDDGCENATSQLRRRQSGLQNPQPTFDFRSRAEKRLSFTLVFQTLKCEILNVYVKLIIY